MPGAAKEKPRVGDSKPGRVEIRFLSLIIEGMIMRMRFRTIEFAMPVVLFGIIGGIAQAQNGNESAPGRPSAPQRTVKPIVMGQHYAVTSMMPQATLAAQRILESGGNAFDAIVGGQAVLGLVAPAANGLGSDAVLLVYDAKQKKVWSINAEGVAPRLATIDWYRQNREGKL